MDVPTGVLVQRARERLYASHSLITPITLLQLTAATAYFEAYEAAVKAGDPFPSLGAREGARLELKQLGTRHDDNTDTVLTTICGEPVEYDGCSQCGGFSPEHLQSIEHGIGAGFTTIMVTFGTFG